MTRIELKLMVENNKLSFIDMDESLLTDISDENLQLLKNKHPLALNFLKEFGGTGISKKNRRKYVSILYGKQSVL